MVTCSFCSAKPYLVDILVNVRVCFSTRLMSAMKNGFKRTRENLPYRKDSARRSLIRYVSNVASSTVLCIPYMHIILSAREKRFAAPFKSLGGLKLSGWSIILRKVWHCSC